jgi:site-specific DNA-cytosine methylase
MKRYAISLSRVSKYYRVLDVVTPDSTYCNCFTKGYGKNILGAGSVLASRAAGEELCKKDERGRLHLEEDPYLHSRSQRQQDLKDQPGRSREHPEPLQDDQAEDLQLGLKRQLVGSGSGLGNGVKGSDAEVVVGGGSALPLRFFTPREVANIHGLPQAAELGGQQSERDCVNEDPGFSFPPDVTDRQAYALLGNSLSVDVVAVLMTCLLNGWVACHACCSQDCSL